MIVESLTFVKLFYHIKKDFETQFPDRNVGNFCIFLEKNPENRLWIILFIDLFLRVILWNLLLQLLQVMLAGERFSPGEKKTLCHLDKAF